jgi:predicted nucleic acid-binding protein
VSYLLDTCTVSEGARPDMNAGVRQWLVMTPIELQCVSVLSFAEIEFGILKLSPGRRRSNLESWVEGTVKPFFGSRVLAFDEAAAHAWAKLRIRDINAPIVDGQIAATAIAGNLTLVTRNVRDFRFEGLRVLNPWTE